MKGQIRQFCVIVGDLEASMESYWSKFGIGPFQKNHFTPETSHDICVKGKKVEEDYHFCCACCWEGDMEYELIRPYKGPNIYWDHLEAFGPGMHHFKVVIPDNDELREYMNEMEEKGMKVLQTGWIDQDVHYYIDSYDKLGMVVEFGNGGAIRACTDFYPEDRNLPRPVSHQQNIRRISLVVDDLDRYQKNWEELMDVTGWKRERCSADSAKAFEYKGNPIQGAASFTRARVYVGGIEVELIQPEEGPGVYRDFLEKHGTGLFMITDVCTPEEFRETAERMKKEGMQISQMYQAGDTCEYCFDTQEEFSVVIGLANA